MRALAVATLTLAAACIPTFEDDASRVTARRVLAVRAVPAEVKPGEPVTLTALVATPDGSAGTADLAWARCAARKPLTELGPVAQVCIDRFGTASDALAPLGQGDTVALTVPADACQAFGPLPPPADASGISARPVDPDSTGGYYLPLVLGAGADRVLASVRLACGPTGVPSAEAVRFNQGSRPNENPSVERFELRDGARVVGLAPGDPSAVVAPGARVELRVTWAHCPRTPTCGDGLCTAGENAASCAADCREGARGCSGAETYLVPNPSSRVVEERSERLRVAWFATDGAFREEQTGGDDATESVNSWTAPATRGEVVVWGVLRDDRGGVGFARGIVRVD